MKDQRATEFPTDADFELLAESLHKDIGFIDLISRFFRPWPHLQFAETVIAEADEAWLLQGGYQPTRAAQLHRAFLDAQEREANEIEADLASRDHNPTKLTDLGARLARIPEVRRHTIEAKIKEQRDAWEAQAALQASLIKPLSQKIKEQRADQSSKDALGQSTSTKRTT